MTPSALPANGLLDDLNRAIIDELRSDGRRTYGSIAEAVGLSEAAVRQRVQKLRDTGVVQIVAVTDPIQLGLRCRAMVGIHVDGDVRRVAEQLAAIGDIDLVVLCAGSYDLLVQLVCKDEASLLDLLNGVVRTIPGVHDTETFVYLDVAKQTHSWGAG